MRKEARRSLLLWPVAASATITAMSWFPTVVGPDVLSRSVRSVFPQRPVVVLGDELNDFQMDLELPSRRQYGSRAMKLPDRVAEVFSVDPENLKAPVRSEQRELAGLVLRPPVSFNATAQQLADDLFSGNILVADPIAENPTTAIDQSMESQTLQSMRNRQHLPTPTPTLAETAPPALVGPSRPEFWEPEIVALSASQWDERPVLPRSNRALGKRIVAAAEPIQGEVPRSMEEPVTDSPRPADVLPGLESEESPIANPPVVTIEVEKADAETRPIVEHSPAGWPVTRRLEEQLQSLSAMVINDRQLTRDQLVSASTSVSPIVRWSDDVTQKLKTLQSLPRLGDQRAGELIDELSDLAVEGLQRAETLTNRRQQISWLQASYAVARRVAVWQSVWEVAGGQEPTWIAADERIDASQSIQEIIESVRADLDPTGDIGGWTQYLLLDDLDKVSSEGQLDQRTLLAQRFLSRLDWHGLDSEQQRWLDRQSVTQLAASIRPWAHDAVDYAALMSQIERQESDAIDLAAIDIADAVQTLRFADNPKATRIAQSIDTHYRNANVRLAISQPMLQRMLPTIASQSVPVQTRMFGSQVRGTSRIVSDLQVELKPSDDRWQMQLKTSGEVHTQSTGRNGSVAVRTAGKSDFMAATPVEVTPHRVLIGGSEAEVHGRTKLRGIHSDYDGWPLIGSLVRSIAESRYNSLALRSNQIANQQIQTQVEKKIDTQVDQRLGTATSQLSEMVLGPLGKLRLDPKVTDMRTTESRLLARYRLAGDWQLAAFTPRPRALRTSLMSMQVHQSALNNTLEQLVPRDQPMSIREMIRSGAKTFGQSDVQLPNDIPDDVNVQFARTRPITVEIDDGRLWITLRIVRLNRRDRGDLTQFIVRAAYKPQIDGLHASLIRDGHLRISGPGMSMRERLPVRAIFNKVLSPNQPLHLTLPQLVDHPATENLVVSQLELRSGWIAMSISESDAPRLALLDPEKNVE